MEKISPFINAFKNHHFWLLAIIVIALPTWAWSGATEDLRKKTETKKTAITGAFTAANDSSGANQSWINNAQEKNNANEEELQGAVGSLYLAQQKPISWPKSMGATMDGIAYRDDFNTDQLQRFYFGFEVDGYESQFQPLLEKLDPYQPDESGIGRGKVLTKASVFPYMDGYEQYRKWLPTPQEMWDAQEDLQLTEAIVDVLAGMNSTAISIGDSPLKRINKISLVGGSVSDFRDPAGFNNEATPVADEGAGGGGFMSRGKEEKAEEQRKKKERQKQQQNRSNSSRGNSFQSDLGNNSASFEPKSIFGNPKEDPSKAGAAGNSGGNTTGGFRKKDISNMSRREKEDYMEELAKAEQAAAEAAKTALADPTKASGKVARAPHRYIDNSADLPYVTRGFYLEVTIDHRKLPELIGNLTNMPYPTVVAKVNAVSLQHNSANYLDRQVGRGMGGRRDEDEEEEEVKEEKPVMEASLTELLGDPYLADVAIAGYMAIFTLESPEAQAILFPDQQPKTPTDSEESADKTTALKTEETEITQDDEK